MYVLLYALFIIDPIQKYATQDTIIPTSQLNSSSQTCKDTLQSSNFSAVNSESIQHYSVNTKPKETYDPLLKNRHSKPTPDPPQITKNITIPVVEQSTVSSQSIEPPPVQELDPLCHTATVFLRKEADSYYHYSILYSNISSTSFDKTLYSIPVSINDIDFSQQPMNQTIYSHIRTSQIQSTLLVVFLTNGITIQFPLLVKWTFKYDFQLDKKFMSLKEEKRPFYYYSMLRKYEYMQPPMGLAMDIDPYKYELKEVERLYRGSFPFVTL